MHYNKGIDEILRDLASNKNGLSSDVAKVRLEKNGKNL